MTQWRSQFPGPGALSGNVTEYGSLGASSAGTATEAANQIKLYIAYTLSNLRIKVTTNTGTNQVGLRDDGSGSISQLISVTATGWLEDVTGSDTPAANSLVCVAFSSTAHGNALTVKNGLLTYEHSSSNAPLLIAGHNVSSFSTSMFFSVGTRSSTEDETRLNLFRPSVCTNLRTYLTTAGASGLTVSVGINGASSSNVTVSPTATGAFEDTTGSESYSANDDYNIRAIRTSNSWLINVLQAQLDTQTGLIAEVTAGDTATTRLYAAFYGVADAALTADDNYTARMGSITAANLQCYCTAAGTGTRDVTLRVASANSTNLTCSITGTGYFEDVSGSDSVGDTDHLGWSLASTGTAITIVRVAVEAPWVTDVVPPARPVNNLMQAVNRAGSF